MKRTRRCGWLLLLLATLVRGSAQQSPTECRGVPVFTPNTIARYLVPKDPALQSVWMQPGFQDDSWARGNLGIGYDTGQGGNRICDDLVLYATMDRVDIDSQQRLIRDVSGPTVHNGTALQIPNINDGQVNEALLFEAAQAVAFSESAELEPGTGDFTAALWIRTLGKGNEILVTKGGLNQRSPGWAIVNTTTQTVVQVVLASGAMIRAPMPRIEPEIWAHVAFVVNRDMKSLRLYRDGKVVNVEALPADPIAAQGEPLRLSIPATAAVNFIGLMDEFMIWKRALSDGEIAGVYEAGRNGDSLKDECGGGGGGSGTLYTPLIATDVTGDMRGVNPSIYIRIPFEISDPALVGKLDLAMNYDDGFVCYLNGVEVARRNAGSQAFLPFNATAVTDRPDPAALTPEVIPLSGRIPLLVPGTNVLAIQGLNVTADAARFVIRPALCVEQVVAEDCIKTTEGRDFWLTFPGNAPADTNNPLHLTVCITGPAGTTGNVQIPGLSFDKPFTIPANGPVAGTGSTIVELPPEAALEESGVIRSNAVHITASRNVAVYGTSRIDYSTDTFLALPTPCLGRAYAALGYKNVWRDLPILNGTQFAIAGVFDGTRVVIDPGPSRAGGVPFEIILNRGETYMLRDTEDEPSDLSGSAIQASAPVGLFAGHRCANINGEEIFFCNLALEQILPLSAWGTQFFTAPLSTRVHSVPQRKGDTLRIVAAQDLTSVTVTDDRGATNVVLAAGAVHEQLVIGPARIVARAPVLAALYSNSSDFDLVTNSDPFMALLQPVGSWMNRYLICAPPTLGGTTDFEENYVNVITPATSIGAAIRVNGVAVGGFLPITGTGFAYAQVKLDPARDTHLIDSAANVPFALTVYGFSEYDAYGYPGGFASVTPVPPTILCGDDVEIRVRDGCSAPLPDLRDRIEVIDPCDDPGRPDVCFEFEDLQINTQFTVGQTFVTTSAGESVPVEVGPFFFSSGTAFTNGFARVVAGGQAGHTGNEFMVNNVNLIFRPATPWPGLSILFGEFGGNINLSVNGELRNVANFMDLNGTTIGGALIQVITIPGANRGEIRVAGTIQSFGIGGQELFIDHLCTGRQDVEPGESCFEFEDLQRNAQFPVNQSFTTTSESGATTTVDIGPFFFSNGQSFSNGFARVTGAGQAGHTGNEILVNNVNLIFRPPSPWPGLSILYGEFGGNINLAVNGVLRNEEDFTALNGATIAGALVTVIPTPGTTGRGEIRISGSIRDFAIGGQELFVDHLCVGPQPGSNPVPGLAASGSLMFAPNFVITQEPPPGTVLPAGEHEVVITVRSPDGRLIGTCVRRVRLQDHSPVKIECPEEIVATCETDKGVRVFFDEVRAMTERCGQMIPVVFDPPSGSVFPPGVTQVRAAATGPAGDRAECTFNVRVNCETIGTRRITFTVTNQTQLRIFWEPPGFLEAAPTVRGPWTPVAGAQNGDTVEISGPSRFFRVQFP